MYVPTVSDPLAGLRCDHPGCVLEAGHTDLHRPQRCSSCGADLDSVAVSDGQVWCRECGAVQLRRRDLRPKDWAGEPVDRSLVDDLADVLVKTCVGWKDVIGHDLTEAPEVKRVLARYHSEVTGDE